MATNKVQYMGRNSDSWPSPRVWADCPMAEILQHGIGYGYKFDFLDIPATGTITTEAEAQIDGMTFDVFGDSGGTVAATTDEAGGVLALTTDTTDNDAISLRPAIAPFIINSAAGKLWYEARVKVSKVTASTVGWFVGLCDIVAQTTTVPLTATGALADTINIVGFHKPEANTTAMDAVYKANTVTAVEVNSDVGTLAADTYIKLGMVFDPSDTVSHDARLRFYINGAEQASSKLIPASSGTDFPADAYLAPIISLCNGSGAASVLEADWVQCYQLR